MLISKKILSQYMDLSDITASELADKITAAGFEVEGLEKMASGTNLVIAEVKECVPHPDSDHLNVCQVDTGKDVRQIVCGAPNCREGLKVIAILPGGKLEGGEIKNGVIRGVESNGMLCSLLELGVDPKSLTDYQKAGIEELPADAPIGETDVLGYLGLDDEILDVGLTPNRNDCMAAFAMAKEVGAILKKKVTLPDFKDASKTGEKGELVVKSETDKCPLYSGKIINSITIKESPKWMKEFLAAEGVKSINNVVDISNIVMLETGQPLHFFDLAKLSKKEIIVKDNMECKYTALDGVEYDITKDDIMITVDNKPVAIGGVMGGDDSKISDDTTSLLIEAASFDHVSIRNTARRLNLSTDASIRYQKGIEPNAPFAAMDRAVSLLIEYADAKGIEATEYSAERTVEENSFDVSVNGINNRLGTSFSAEAMIDVLERLEFKPVANGDTINVTIPTYRTDVTIEADISEEIIRIIGYDDLPSTLPLMTPTAGRLDARQSLRRKLRNVLCNQGLYEAETYTLVSEKLNNDAIMPLAAKEVVLASPMSEDRKIIRTSILPSLLNSVAYNMNRSIKDVALFEISNVYRENIVEERLAIAISGNLQATRWLKYEVPADFYTIKGIVESILEHLGYASGRVTFKENTIDTDHFHPYQSACVYIGKELLGIIGKIHPNMAKDYDTSEVVMAELKIDVLLKNKASKIKFAEISKYPAVTRDYAFVVEDSVKVDDIIKTINKCGKSIIENIEVFDVYTGEHVEANHKSIALTVTFQAKDKTLTEEEINTVNDKILENLKKNVNAELRA